MRPLVLVVLDGWGVNSREDFNATRLAETPNIDNFIRNYPYTEIKTSGLSVGLPDGQMGNSEVGHLTLGSGRVVFQELTRINRAIDDGSFFGNRVLNETLSGVKTTGGALHLMGLVSDGGVHSHIDHLYAILRLAKKKNLDKVFIHAFLDGRDTPPESGSKYLEDLVEETNSIGLGRIATVTGRFYAMDRDKRWERVEKAYNAMVCGEGVKAKDPVTAVIDSYESGKTDEFVEPTVITKGDGEVVGKISDGDAVIFFNFRADRARELSSVLALDDFDGFKRKLRPKLTNFITMTEYDQRIALPAIFPPSQLKNILGEVLSLNQVRQFRVSETEKYAHVTFFFNGGVEEPFSGEDRLLIPSVKDVPTYDYKPEMRAMEIAEAAVERIDSGEYDFVLINFANLDMVGHTGKLEAAIKACEAVDSALGKVADAALKRGWVCIITSDHGNAEQMLDYETKKPHTAHTTNPVPFILVDNERKRIELKDDMGLADVAPTVLELMGLDVPDEMEGKSILR